MGLDRSSNLGHVARAVLEGIALQTYELAQAMTQDSGQPIPVLKVDGGVTANELAMQLQADILGVPVSRPVVAETTALGAAYAAGLARRQGARLVCVYVERPSAMYGAAAGAGASAIAAQEQALHETATDLRREAEEGARRLGLALTFVVARGDPYTELRRVADEVRADAVIVGASMQAGHRWIGSLAVRLVKAGRWPVTVVP